MAIRNLQQLREKAPAEFRNLSDEDLVDQYSRNSGMPFEQAADFFGIAPRGTLREMGRQLVGGAVVDLPKMVGQGLRYTELAPEYGKEMEQAAEARAPSYAPDMRDRGLAGKVGIYGARGVAPVVGAGALMFTPGGQVTAPVLAGALFGTSAAQETYDKILEQTGDPEAATAAARRVGLIQGVGEGAATLVGGRVLKGLAPALTGGARTAGQVATGLTNTAVAKPFLKGMAINAAVQPATEVAQDLGTYAVEQAYGAKAEDPYAIAEQSALGGLGLTLLLGPLALGSHRARSNRAAALKDALFNPEADPKVTAQARDLVMAEAKRQGIPDSNIDSWFNRQLTIEDQRNDALRQEEERTRIENRDKQINLMGETAQGLEGLQGGAFSSLDQQRKFEQGMGKVAPNVQGPFGSLEQQQTFEGGLTTARDANIARVGGEYQDLMANRMAGQMAAEEPGQQWQAIQNKRDQGLQAAQDVGEQWQEIKAGKSRTQFTIEEMGREWQKMQEGIAQPVTGNLTRGQQAALRGPQGKRLKPTTSALPARELPPSTTLLSGEQAPTSALPPQAPAPSSQLSERPVAIAPLGESTPLPSAPVAGGVSSKTQKQAEPVATVEDDKALGKLLSDVDTVDVGNPLPAAVRGAATVKAPGRTSIGLPMLKKIRDALLRPSGKVGAGAGEQEQKIVDALRSFTEAYKVYLDKGGKLLRVKDQKNLDKASQDKFEELQVFAENVRATLADVGKAVNGNAKDVEAIVRLVKDMAQGRIVVPGKTRSEVIQAGKKLDTMLSQAWASAKRETFMGETVDLADVRSGDVRQSKEVAATGEMSPIEKAATEGVGNPKGKGQKYTGLAGVLQYIRNSGTPFERQLAFALREVLDSQMNDVKLEFISKGNSYFDPKTNTVYLSRNESPEVVIHEAFHAALQSFVYKNPKDPAVMQLKKSLKQVVDYKGELTGKAKEVQDLLKKLVAEKKELDAVLELISYNNTLNDFRKALQAMPTKGVPASFRESVNSIWRAIKNIARRMLGSTDSVASDVLQSSLALLEKASKVAPEKGMGNVLKAEITSASKINPQDYREYNKKVAPAALSTKVLFDVIGWKRGADKFSEVATKTADALRKDFPTAVRYLTYINSRFNVNAPTSAVMENYKVDKNTGYQRMEQLANYVESRSATEANAIFDYLDGNEKALDKLPDSAKMKEIADSIKKQMAMYISELPAKDKAYFENTKFSESLLFASKTSQVASHTFGARKLSEIIGLQHRFEETIEGFQHWMGKDKNGDVDITGPFYQVFGPNIKDPAGPQVPQGYMSIKEYNAKGNPIGYTVDPSRQWRISGKKGEGYKFTSNMTAQQAILEKKVTSLANAMRNTMAALSNNYASRNFSKAASEIGYEDGKPTELSVAFDSTEDIKKVFGRAPTPLQILSVSEDESKTPEIADLYRNSNTWVRIPAVEAYGALAGKLMPGPVWSAMTDMADRKPLVSFRSYNATLRWFKKSKTVYNPGTHVTNIATNVTMAMMHDIPVKTIASAANLFAKYEVNPKSLSKSELEIMSQFMNSGAMLGDYSSAEVKEAIYKAWSENLAQPTDTSLLQRLKMFTGYEKSKAQMGVALATKYANKADSIATELYAAEDNVFRLAAFMKKAGELQELSGAKTPTPENFKEAGTFARKAFLDYDIDSKAVRILRQSALPFVSWTYAIMPVMGRIALHQPWKIANVAMAYYLLDAAMASMAGDDDEETRKKGPEAIRERMFGIGPYMHIRIPFMGDSENPVYYKLGDYIPLASAFKGMPNGFFGVSGIPSAITPSNPLLSAFSSMVVGVDAYTGKSIHQPTDTEWQKFRNAMKAGYDIVMPPAVNSRQIKAVNDILDEKTGMTGAPVSNLAIARMFGLKLYDYNVTEAEAVQEVVAKRIERDFKDAMRKSKREEYRKGYPDYEELDSKLADLQTRMQEQMDKARGGTGEID